jgi:hypothetical protein
MVDRRMQLCSSDIKSMSAFLKIGFLPFKASDPGFQLLDFCSGVSALLAG